MNFTLCAAPSLAQAPQDQKHRPSEPSAPQATSAAAASPEAASPPKPEAAAAGGRPPSLVVVDEVRAQPLADIFPLTGYYVSLRETTITARVGAAVDDLAVRVGDRVSAGQRLLQQDRRSLAATRSLAAGRILEAEALLTLRRTELTYQEMLLGRQEDLRGSSVFTSSARDDAEQQMEIAHAAADQADVRLNPLRAELRRADIALGDTTITAPFAGVVTETYVDQGGYLQIGGAVLRLLDDQALELEVAVPTALLPGLTESLEVAVVPPRGAGFSALLRAILPEEDSRTGTRRVRFTPQAKPDLRLAAKGAAVVLNMPTGEFKQGLTIHKDAVIRDPALGALVFLMQDGRAVPRPVTLGRSVGGRFEVLRGVGLGELAVVRGNERLHPGAPLRVAPPPSAQAPSVREHHAREHQPQALAVRQSGRNS